MYHTCYRANAVECIHHIDRLRDIGHTDGNNIALLYSQGNKPGCGLVYHINKGIIAKVLFHIGKSRKLAFPFSGCENSIAYASVRIVKVKRYITITRQPWCAIFRLIKF